MPTFGRYEIEKKLGEGAMGVVHQARDLTLGRVVALKLLSAEGAEDELHKRFQREAEAIGRLDHPNIVKIYDLGDAEGQLYMAMELLDGEDLRTLIEQPPELPVSERVRILEEICIGLGYAHSRGVIHRDIKPANIVVNANGRVKILDFGLARVATRATITRKGVIIGTPDYMCPEQAMGRTVDPRSDIFSAGSVFYEFLTLQKPFIGKTLHAVLYQIISEQPVPMLTLNPELPARLAHVVHTMLAKDPDQRYQAMDVLLQELREIRVALRRSRSRSTQPAPAPPTSPAAIEEVRSRLREQLKTGRVLYESRKFSRAIAEFQTALSVDPDSREAGELLWRASRKRESERKRTPLDAETAARVESLLPKAAPDAPADEARNVIAELALIAPDDPRVIELLRERAEQGR